MNTKSVIYPATLTGLTSLEAQRVDQILMRQTEIQCSETRGRVGRTPEVAPRANGRVLPILGPDEEDADRMLPAGITGRDYLDVFASSPDSLRDTGEDRAPWALADEKMPPSESAIRELQHRFPVVPVTVTTLKTDKAGLTLVKSTIHRRTGLTLYEFWVTFALHGLTNPDAVDLRVFLRLYRGETLYPAATLQEDTWQEYATA